MTRRRFLAQSAALIAAPFLPSAAASYGPPMEFVYGSFRVIGTVRLGDQTFVSDSPVELKRIFHNGRLIWEAT